MKGDEGGGVGVAYPFLEEMSIVLYHVWSAVQCGSLVWEVGKVRMGDGGDLRPTLAYGYFSVPTLELSVVFTAVSGERIDVESLSGGSVSSDDGAKQKVSWGIVGL